MLCFNMSTAKQPQVSLTGTIQKLNIQVICFKPTVQLSHLNSTIYATPKCSYMYLSLTQCFLSFFQKKEKLNHSCPQFTTVCFVSGQIHVHLRKTSISLVAIFKVNPSSTFSFITSFLLGFIYFLLVCLVTEHN